MFEDFPLDILIEISTYLELDEATTLFSVCSSFRKLRESRYLWLALLERTQRRRNLACPIGTDISQLDIAHLQQIAHHTNRIERNWGRPRPRIARAVKSIPYMSPSEIEPCEPAPILAVIPGTSLVVLYAQVYAERVILCDIDGSLPTSGIHVGRISRRAHFDEPGRHLIALVIGSHFDVEISLRVLSIEYGDGKIPTIQQIFAMTLESQACRDLFLYKNVVGMIPYSQDDSPISIHAINFFTNISVHIPVDIGDLISNTSYVFCSVSDGEPYIITVDHEGYEVYRCPTDLLPCDNEKWENGAIVEGNLIKVASIRATDFDDCYDFETPDINWSPKGLQSLCVAYRYGSGPQSNTHASFWPIDPSQSPLLCQDHTVATKQLSGKVGLYLDSRDSPWLVASTPSGMYTAVVLYREGENPEPILSLLHFQDEPRSVQAHELELPFYITLDQIYAIALDERLGVVYLSHVSGYLFAIPYA